MLNQLSTTFFVRLVLLPHAVLHDLYFVMTIITSALVVLTSLLSVLINALAMFLKAFLGRIDHLNVNHGVLHVTLS
jgi:hypothetical protein